MKTELAEQFQKDRIFLIGDAAHVFPPAGGFGMNTGIQVILFFLLALYIDQNRSGCSEFSLEASSSDQGLVF